MPELYGIPYKGSKSGIAEEIISMLPTADTFVDVCAGGCAMTHAAILSGKYKHFIINDIDPLPTKCFIDSIAGKYRNENRWISREDFFNLKDTDPYVKYCFSFSGSGMTYVYHTETEGLMKAWHAVCFSRNVYQRNIELSHLIEAYTELLKRNKRSLTLSSIQSRTSEHIKRLKRLQRLEKLQAYPGAKNIKRYNVDFAEVPIPNDCVIYCDIPYQSSDLRSCYNGVGFDFSRFYDWAYSQKHPLFISEYSLPDDRFKCVWKKFKRVGTTHGLATERLFAPVKRGAQNG